jgi:23S rRNA pseudouridine1911/1915/1917 synthase
MQETIQRQATVPPEMEGDRLDQIAASLFNEFSRARLQQWIKAGDLRVNQQSRKPKDKLLSGDELVLHTEMQISDDSPAAEAIELNILYEDASLIIINKPAGMVVHPAAGNRAGTLLNGLLHHCPGLEQIPRAGIVHRLDKDTTGLMVVAKTLQAHHSLVKQLQKRTVTRLYQAIVVGVLTGGGTVDAPLGRHPVHRKKRAVVEDGKDAVTHYRLMARYRGHTRVQCQLETGRTHQIRVHMAHIRHPLIGDPDYGRRLAIPAGASTDLAETLRSFRRQALHAWKLSLIHPESGEEKTWECPLPEDMLALVAALEKDQNEAGA